jgi:hypothetical protein
MESYLASAKNTKIADRLRTKVDGLNHFGFRIQNKESLNVFASIANTLMSWFEFLKLPLSTISIRGGAVLHLLFGNQLNDIDIMLDSDTIKTLFESPDLQNDIEYVFPKFSICVKNKDKIVNTDENFVIRKKYYIKLDVRNNQTGGTFVVELFERTRSNKDFELTSIAVDYTKEDHYGTLNLTQNQISDILKFKEKEPIECLLFNDFCRRQSIDKNYCKRLVLRITKFLDKGGKIKNITDLRNQKKTDNNQETQYCSICMSSSTDEDDLWLNKIFLDFCKNNHRICISCFIKMAEKSYSSEDYLCPLCREPAFLITKKSNYNQVNQENQMILLRKLFNILNYCQDVQDPVPTTPLTCTKRLPLSWGTIMTEIKKVDLPPPSMAIQSPTSPERNSNSSNDIRNNNNNDLSTSRRELAERTIESELEEINEHDNNNNNNNNNNLSTLTREFDILTGHEARVTWLYQKLRLLERVEDRFILLNSKKLQIYYQKISDLVTMTRSKITNDLMNYEPNIYSSNDGFQVQDLSNLLYDTNSLTKKILSLGNRIFSVPTYQIGYNRALLSRRPNFRVRRYSRPRSNSTRNEESSRGSDIGFINSVRSVSQNRRQSESAISFNFDVDGEGNFRLRRVSSSTEPREESSNSRSNRSRRRSSIFSPFSGELQERILGSENNNNRNNNNQNEIDDLVGAIASILEHGDGDIDDEARELYERHQRDQINQ